MKILIANTTAYPQIGGVENSLRFMGRELLRAGHEVKVFCFQTVSGEISRIEHDGVEIVRYPLTKTHWPHHQFANCVAETKRLIPQVLGEFAPDAIWSRSAYVGLGIRRSGYKGRLIQIFSTNAEMNCRGLFLQTNGLPARRRLMLLGMWPLAYLVSSRLERELAPQCEPVAFSYNMRRQLLRSFPGNACRCHLIPPGVDSDLFSPDNGFRYLDAIERKYGLRRSDQIVLYVGRLSSAKNIPMLMDAVCLLGIKVKLVLVGSGPEEARLQSYARSIGLTDRTIFAGAQSEMLAGFYAVSRVCVLPSTIESFGQVYLESLAVGTPVVGFGDDRCRIMTAANEIIRDGETGAIVAEVGATALAKKIDEILSLNKDNYAAMSKRARDDVRERFSWQNFVSQILSLSFRCRGGQL